MVVWVPVICRLPFIITISPPPPPIVNVFGAPLGVPIVPILIFVAAPPIVIVVASLNKFTLPTLDFKSPPSNVISPFTVKSRPIEKSRIPEVKSPLPSKTSALLIAAVPFVIPSILAKST